MMSFWAKALFFYNHFAFLDDKGWKKVKNMVNYNRGLYEKIRNKNKLRWQKL